MKGQIFFFLNNPSESTKKFSETYIIKMFLLTTYLLCLVEVFFNRIGIPMGTNCAHVLADLCLRGRLHTGDTTDTDRYASYLDLYLEIDSEGRLRTIKDMISIIPL